MRSNTAFPGRPAAAAAQLFFVLALLLPAVAARAKTAGEEVEKLEHAREVYQALIGSPDSSVPRKLMQDCKCVAVFPGVIKGALGVGARHGNGVISCRSAAGGWSAPAFLTMTGGSYGLQIGVEKTQAVLFFMNEQSARSLLRSKFTLGAKAGVAAGPVGRSAEGSTDLRLNAEIYSYARSKGAFIGLSLEGAKVAPDKDAIVRYYGRPIASEAIVFDAAAPVQPSAQRFLEVLPAP